jgi:hypothetical protein
MPLLQIVICARVCIKNHGCSKKGIYHTRLDMEMRYAVYY